MNKDVLAIIIAVIGSGAFTALTNALVQNHHEGKRGDRTMKQTVAAVSYWALSNELERLLTKGWASPDERRTVGVLYDSYKNNGWNGDMNARMDRLFHMPTADIHNKEGEEYYED